MRFSISCQCSFGFRDCTRFSSVHDEFEKRFMHVRSLFLRTNAFLIRNKINLQVKIKIYIGWIRQLQFLRVGFCTLTVVLFAGIYDKLILNLTPALVNFYDPPGQGQTGAKSGIPGWGPGLSLLAARYKAVKYEFPTAFSCDIRAIKLVTNDVFFR